MNKKTIVVVLLIILNISTTFAQFIQEGSTLEYKGDRAKVPYTDLVSLDFVGAANTVNEKGYFSLSFNQLSAGNMVGEFNITIGDKQYVLFNKPIIQRWILTNDAKMEVLLCRKSHIDNLVNTYTKAHVSKLEKQYFEAKEEIEKQIRANKGLEQDINDLVHKLSDLKNHYEMQIATIRANAIMFAYVDETKLDSLEKVKRNCILHNDIERAIEIGREIDYSKIANNLINNATLSQASYIDKINKLFSVADYVQQHIDNCFNVNKTWYYEYWKKDKEDPELAGYFQILSNIYEYLIEQYTTFIRCDEKFLLNLKQKYGDALFRIAMYSDLSIEKAWELLKKAADFNSPEALYKLGDTENDFYKAKSYLERCIEVVNNDLLKDVAKERYESFPDFLYITKDKDSIYCHIISDFEKKVNICDFHLGNERDLIKIPGKVKYRGKTYTITKVGCRSFRNVCWNDWDNSPFQHKSCGGMRLRLISGTIILPNTITEIGRKAFFFQSGLSAIEFPQTLKVIKDYAFEECWRLRTVIIPEGVEEIGHRAFDSYTDWEQSKEEDIISISLPSTLKTLHQDSFLSPYVSDIRLSGDNPHFQLINGVLYSADSTILYHEIIPTNTEVLFIPNNLSIEEIPLYYMDSLKKIIINPTHKLYSEYKDIIYSKDFSSIISIPRDLDWIEFHPNLKYEPYFLLKTTGGLRPINTRKVIVNQDLNPNIKYSLYCDFIAQECGHSTENIISVH